MVAFEPSSLYRLSTTGAARPTLAGKTIVDVIGEGKVVALPREDEVIDVDTPGVDLGVVNA